MCPQIQCVSSETVRQCVSSESVRKCVSSKTVRQCVLRVNVCPQRQCVSSELVCVLRVSVCPQSVRQYVSSESVCVLRVSVCPQSVRQCVSLVSETVCVLRDSVCPQSQCVSSETVSQCVSSETVCVLRDSETVCVLRDSETVCVKLKLVIEATSWDSNVSHEESSSLPLVLLVNNRFRSRGLEFFISFTHVIISWSRHISLPNATRGAVTYTLTRSQMFYQLFFLHLAAVTEFLLFWIMCLFSSDFYYRTV